MVFEMIGKLSMPKDTDKFHPYEETKYDSGWVRRRLTFNVICGDNRHFLTINAGSFEDENKGFVYTFSKPSVDDNGNKKKSEPITIPFKERLTSPKLAEVAEWKKFIIDLEKPQRRYKLEKAAERVKEGTSLTDEEMAELEIESESGLNEALEKSKKKRHEFITEWDFAEFIKKVLDSGKYKDKKFLIKGNGSYTYSDAKERVYDSLVPQRIYLANDDTEAKSEATISIIYNQESFDDMSVDEKERYYVNGYMMEYDNNRKGNIPVPVTIAIPTAPENATDKEKGKINSLKRKFIVDDDSWKEIGVVVDMINGAQKTEITEDMLTDEQKEDLEYGLITMEDIRAELGSNVYGERIQEYRFQKIAKGYSKGRNDTAYTDEDMKIKPIVNEAEDVVGNLFDDDDEL